MCLKRDSKIIKKRVQEDRVDQLEPAFSLRTVMS